MSTYTKTTNFTAKDNLTSGDPAKVIKGSEFDTEFNSIETAVNSKANANNGTHTGTTTISTANIDTLQVDGVEVTATPAELNTLDGITSTTAELNKLDGFTGTVDDLNYAKDLRATGVTSAEFDTLDGLTATTAELNTLDGITSTTAELNFVDGVTSNIQTQLNSKANLSGANFTGNVDVAGSLSTDGLTVDGTDESVGITAGTFGVIGSNTTSGGTGTTSVVLGTFVDEGNEYFVSLNRGGVEKLRTTSTGVDITGDVSTDTLTINGTTVTATATELNYTDGVTSSIQTQLDAMVEKSGDTMTGDLSLGDNVKAKFGASDDLQIYHDGGNSYVQDAGSGKLILKSNGTATLVQDAVGGALAEFHTGDREARLYQAGSLKLATTSTGVDVTGTLVSDGLTVGGTTSLTGLTKITGVRGTFVDPSEDPSVPNIFSTNDAAGDFSQEAGHLVIQPRVHPTVYRDVIFAGGAGTTKRLMNIKGEGDVEFFEDTGTTAKMVWSSSDEKLSLNGKVNSEQLSIDGATGGFRLKTWAGNAGTANSSLYSIGLDYAEGLDSNGKIHFYRGASSGDGALTFETNASERMRIDSTGNVGIGETDPNERLHINGTLKVAINSVAEADGYHATIQSQYGDNPLKILSCGKRVLEMGGFTAANTLKLYTGDTERARIDSSGRLLVGTTANVGQAGKFLADGGSAVKGIAAVTETICSGASGTFGTITISFSGNHSSSTGIMDVQVAGYNVKAVDYCIMQYSSFPTNTLRSNVSSGLTVAITGNPSDGGAWTMTITGGVTHPVVTAKCTAGGLATGFSSAPTISFS